jgi:RNA polymerase sigma factor (sigma-70 family)
MTKLRSSCRSDQSGAQHFRKIQERNVPTRFMQGDMQGRFSNFISELRCRRRAALSAFVDRYQSLARNVVGRNLGHKLRRRVESDDLLNDFWLSVFRRIDRLPSLADSLAMRAYLRRIAFRQVAKNQRRHLKAKCRSLNHEVTVSDLDDLCDHPRSEGSAIVHASEEEAYSLLRSEMREDEWQMIQLKLDGHSNREIGRHLQVDEGSVRRCLRKAGRIVTKRLGHHSEDLGQ